MKKTIVIILIFISLTIAMTYPLIFRINRYIPGFHSTDEPFAALWNFWWFKYAFKHNLADNHYSTLAFPFGFDAGRVTLYPFWQFFYKWLSILTHQIFSFNIQMLLSFPLAAVTMYYLTLYVTGDWLVSLLAALIYAFCPYHFARAWQHLGLAQIEWMPLFILRLIKLKENPALKNMFWAILALFLVFSFELHYAYFMYIVTALFLLYYTFSYKKFDSVYLRAVTRIFLVLLIGAFFLLPTSATSGIKEMFSKEAATASAWSAVRPFEDLFSQSARPLSYFLPASAHPVFGKFSEPFVGSALYGESFTEHTLYLGWVPLILAFIAIQRRRRKRKLGTVPFGDSPCDKEDFYIGFFILLAIASWFFSQPPWWKAGPLKIYMPAFFLYKIAPIFRAYCRFGIVVMLSVAVLAAFGLKFILERFKQRNAKLAVAILCCGLVIFEFWNYPPFKVIDVSQAAQVYSWLKSQTEDFVIAEYPLDADSPNEMYKFYQASHEKKIINGTIPQTHPNKIAKEVKKLSELKTAGILKWLGVKYVLVHRNGYLGTELVEEREELEGIPKNSGLRLIKSFSDEDCPQKDIICVQKAGPVDVYEVVAMAIKPEVK